MIVVADTSPVNYLILIEQIDILPVLYGQVCLPHAVHDELLGLNAPVAVRTWALLLPSWVELLSPSTSAVASIAELDPGEIEAIALAEEINAAWLLIDEIAGRAEAIRRGLQTIGTLGILRDAHKARLLDLKAALQRLLDEGFYASPTLLQTVLESIEPSQ